MSLDYWNRLKHLSAQFDALKIEQDKLAERVLALEAEKEPASTDLDVDTLQPVPKRRGRPPKAKQ